MKNITKGFIGLFLMVASISMIFTYLNTAEDNAHTEMVNCIDHNGNPMKMYNGTSYNQIQCEKTIYPTEGIIVALSAVVLLCIGSGLFAAYILFPKENN